MGYNKQPIGKTILAALVGGFLAFGGLTACVGTLNEPMPAGSAMIDAGETPERGEIAAQKNTDGHVTAFAADVYPDYYRIIGTCDTAPDVVDDLGITYGEPDELGRATWAGGWITSDERAAIRERGRLAEDVADPVGWPDDNEEVDIPGARGRRDYHGWLWNRSHLVADSLGGANIARNMIAGTRTQNVGDNSHPGGMAYTETLARDWLDSHDGAIWYLALPVYEGDEMIPRGVCVDIYSTDGTIDQRVMVFNAANGYDIDYTDGTWNTGTVFD